jgi:flagellar hook-basal body complex protein FliE
MPIDLIKTVPGAGTPGIGPAKTGGAAGDSGGSGFGDLLGKLVSGAEEAGAGANQAVTDMVTKTGDVHDAMIALQRAEMSLQLTVQVRNKLMQAYQDIMRMPV